VTPLAESVPPNTLCICGHLECPVPYGYCHCRCGLQTGIAPRTDNRFGIIGGMPTRFLKHHTTPKPRPTIDPTEILFVDGEECKRIPLTREQTAIVIISDYEWLNQLRWFASWAKNTQSFYARRTGGERVTMFMHRMILGLEHEDARLADHKNGDTLDNRRSNLRIATYSQNCANKKLRKDSTSGFNGVNFEKSMGMWLARVYFNHVEYRIGHFPTAVEARDAQIVKAKELYGEFFPER